LPTNRQSPLEDTVKLIEQMSSVEWAYLDPQTKKVMVQTNPYPLGTEEHGLWLKEHEDVFKAHRRVGYTRVQQYMVSTVMLCLDHGWADKPRWFETMIINERPEEKMEVFGQVFNHEYLDYQWRYAEYEAAKRAHGLIVGHMRRGGPEALKELNFDPYTGEPT
jgi:hypothetical protein